MKVEFIPRKEFLRVLNIEANEYEKLSVIADMCRVNTLSMVKNAGSGHLGSSFSSMDIVVWLYFKVLNTLQVGLSNPERDIYFSSKGHDVPGLYSVLYALGVLSEEQIFRLRKIGGLEGHPDINTKGIEANTGSLGMGISKAKGMSWAKKKMGLKGEIFVMTGDGEFQEGQNFEALQTCIQQNLTNIIVIMDHNKIQSDKPVDQVVSLLDIEKKINSFGWYVLRMNGNYMKDIDETLKKARIIEDKPKFIIADTLKGKGVSFMEHTQALENNGGIYPWHAGAPDDEHYIAALNEIVERINKFLFKYNEMPLALKEFGKLEKTSNTEQIMILTNGEPVSSGTLVKESLKKTSEYVVEAYGKELIKQAIKNEKIVVLDADLSSDCRLREFENTFPDRFIENGIAEQDMVSMAGGLAKMGFLPIVNSFAAFLTSRANEQIYNNCTENSKIIYACHFAGLIPAGPGKSHQSLRDISLLGALPNLEILQPCNSTETAMILDYCINTTKNSTAIRMNIGPSPRNIVLPEGYHLTYGQGVVIRPGNDAAILAYGPVMLTEALRASEILANEDFELEVINMPWLNRIDINWLDSLLLKHDNIFVLEDHVRYGGLGEFLIYSIHTYSRYSFLRNKVKIFAVEGYPACGTPSEVLRYHCLSGEILSNRIKEMCYAE